MNNVFIFKGLFLFLIGVTLIAGYILGDIKLVWTILGLILLGFSNLLSIEATDTDGKFNKE